MPRLPHTPVVNKIPVELRNGYLPGLISGFKRSDIHSEFFRIWGVDGIEVSGFHLRRRPHSGIVVAAQAGLRKAVGIHPDPSVFLDGSLECPTEPLAVE